MTEFGIDAASFQKTVNWAQVDAICTFGFEKVTQGTWYKNPYWPDAKTAMAARAKASGFVPGAYLFLEEGNGAAQADYFAAQAGDLTGFSLAVDVEPTGNSRPVLADALACTARLRERYPRHPIGGYIPHWYWGSQDTTFTDWLWASQYVTGFGTPASLYPQVPASWWEPYGGRQPSLLQFTSTAIVAGVAGAVDCSAFRGTPAELRALLLPPTTPPPPPPPPPTIPDWQVTIMNRLPVLQQGSNIHAAVRRAQALLGPAGAACAVDGIFGPATAAAVRHVQAAHHLSTDGIIGPHTWAVLVTGADL
ncbi:MAG TPA: GH25 family lysozyme [Streptosporangiaceae bacterium]|nr:GH25 family lysozyme [Streptosporangiaceae bacterium]